MKKIVVLSVVAIFIGSMTGAYSFWKHFLNTPMSTISDEVVYEVSPGRSFQSIAKDLQQKGLIKSSLLFVILGKIKNESTKMKVGEYLLNKNMTPNEIMVVINSGKSIEKKMTFSEGLNIFDMADIFDNSGLGSRADFFKIIKDKVFIKSLLNEEHETLEGYLYPETYTYTKYTTMKDVIAQMVKKSLEVYQSLQSSANVKNLSRHQVMTLASIIEKETGAAEERSLISSIFHNRLNKNILLQTDPTVLYGMAVEKGSMPNNISKGDLLRKTTYNTYVIKGLPPGPIANPGKDSIRAAMNPADSEFLFFVSHNDGTHEFTKTYKDHQKAVKKFQLNPKAREGKSWRDLKDKSK